MATATLTILPASDVSHELRQTGSSDHYLVVSDSSDSTYVYYDGLADNVFKTDVFGMSPLTQPACSGAITKVTVYTRVTDYSSSQYSAVYVEFLDGGAHDHMSSTDSWVTESSEFTENPATDAAWTWADVADFYGLIKIGQGIF